jgi:hypothetical protein
MHKYLPKKRQSTTSTYSTQVAESRKESRKSRTGQEMFSSTNPAYSARDEI